MSDRPRSSEVPSEPAPASHIEEAHLEESSDFGRWLTRDLRAKGTPSQLPPPERPSQLPSVVVAAPEEPALASWLLSGLKPRGSVPPDVAVAPQRGIATSALAAQAQTPAAAPVEALLIPVDLEAGDAGSLPPPDSLMPHAVSEAPRAASGGTLALQDALDADDLAVLPSRRRAGGQRRWRQVAVAALLLGILGALFWRGTGAQVEAARADAAANIPQPAEPLPPPPPAQEESAAPAEEPEPAPAHHASGAPAPGEPDLPELPGRAGRRAGDAIARFADLPPPTLSKLAREERQKIREREARARARKAAGSAVPAAARPESPDRSPQP
jgi:hypothetical protein